MQAKHLAAHVAAYNESHPAQLRSMGQQIAILRGAIDHALYARDNAAFQHLRDAAAERLATLRQQAQHLRLAVHATPADEQAGHLAKLDEIAQLLEV